MKNDHIPFRFFFLLGLSVLIMISQSGCSGGEEPSPSRQNEVRTVLTSGVWTAQSVLVDGVDKTEIYEELTLKFTSSDYTAVNGMPVWPPNGTWSFKDDNATALILNDGMEIEIIEATNSSLKLGLAWNETTLGGGRKSSIEGEHVFSFLQ